MLIAAHGAYKPIFTLERVQIFSASFFVRETFNKFVET
jgi:hypothetical protein